MLANIGFLNDAQFVLSAKGMTRALLKEWVGVDLAIGHSVGYWFWHDLKVHCFGALQSMLSLKVIV
jgi:hypothetical protein